MKEEDKLHNSHNLIIYCEIVKQREVLLSLCGENLSKEDRKFQVDGIIKCIDYLIKCVERKRAEYEVESYELALAIEGIN